MREAGTPVQILTWSHDATAVTTSAWTVLDTALNDHVSYVEIFDSSGEALYLGYGAAGAEQNAIVVFPGGNGRIPLNLPAGVRIALKAFDTNTSAGTFIMNCYR